jgi:hypothetical protein
MMLPILISVSVAPVSYFFCANALVAGAATAAAVASRRTCLSFLIDILLFP